MKILSENAILLDERGLIVGRDVVVLDHEDGTISIGAGLHNKSDLVFESGEILPTGANWKVILNCPSNGE